MNFIPNNSSYSGVTYFRGNEHPRILTGNPENEMLGGKMPSKPENYMDSYEQNTFIPQPSMSYMIPSYDSLGNYSNITEQLPPQYVSQPINAALPPQNIQYICNRGKGTPEEPTTSAPKCQIGRAHV